MQKYIYKLVEEENKSMSSVSFFALSTLFGGLPRNPKLAPKKYPFIFLSIFPGPTEELKLDGHSVLDMFYVADKRVMFRKFKFKGNKMYEEI